MIKATGSPASSGTSTPTRTPTHHASSSTTRLMKEPNSLVKDGISSVTTDSDVISGEVEKASSILPTMWLGSQSGR